MLIWLEIESSSSTFEEPEGKIPHALFSSNASESKLEIAIILNIVRGWYWKEIIFLF